METRRSFSGAVDVQHRSRKGRFARLWASSSPSSPTTPTRKRCSSSASDSTDKKSKKNNSPPPKRLYTFPLRGRRIVHLSILAKALSSCGNSKCKTPLALIDCRAEKKFGLASILIIPCKSCGMDNYVDTDSRDDPVHPRPGPRPFTSNRKAALGKWITLKFVNCSGKLQLFIWWTCIFLDVSIRLMCFIPSYNIML